MSSQSERRRDHRIKARFELLYGADRREGAGSLSDISYSGALVEATNFQPEIGTQVRLYVFVQPISPIELLGTVVRLTEDGGFAIEYEKPDDEICRLVDDAAAMVNT